MFKNNIMTLIFNSTHPVNLRNPRMEEPPRPPVTPPVRRSPSPPPVPRQVPPPPPPVPKQAPPPPVPRPVKK